MDADFSKLDSKEIIKKLEDGAFTERFEKGNDWKLFREAFERLGLQAEYKMARIDPIKDPTGVIECQVVSKFCKNILRGIINGLKQEGRVAFEEAKARKLKLTGL